MLKILIALIMFPILEIAIIVQFSAFFGAWPTIFSLVFTALIGFLLIRYQGIKILHDFRHEIKAGQIPAQHMLDRLCFLCGAVLLITPGFCTDALGFLALIPAFRYPALGWLTNRVKTSSPHVRCDSAYVTGSTIDGKYTDVTGRQSSASTNKLSLPPTI